MVDEGKRLNRYAEKTPAVYSHPPPRTTASSTHTTTTTSTHLTLHSHRSGSPIASMEKDLGTSEPLLDSYDADREHSSEEDLTTPVGARVPKPGFRAKAKRVLFYQTLFNLALVFLGLYIYSSRKASKNPIFPQLLYCACSHLLEHRIVLIRIVQRRYKTSCSTRFRSTLEGLVTTSPSSRARRRRSSMLLGSSLSAVRPQLLLCVLRV